MRGCVWHLGMAGSLPYVLTSSLLHCLAASLPHGLTAPLLVKEHGAAAILPCEQMMHECACMVKHGTQSSPIHSDRASAHNICFTACHELVH